MTASASTDTAAPPEDVLQALLQERDQAAIAAASRNWRMGLAQVLCCWVLAAVMAVPAVKQVLGIPGLALPVWFAALGVSLLHTTTAFNLGGGRSRWFLIGASLDTALLSGGAMVQLFLAGTALHPLWLMHAMVLGINIPLSGFRWLFGTAAVAAPVLLVVAFVVAGDLNQAALAAVIGAPLAFAYLVLHSNFRQRLRARLVAEWQQQTRDTDGATIERGRIARDLHDGLGAELVAVVNRARALAHADSARDEATAAVALEVVQAAEATLDELRTVVGALKGQDTSIQALTARLQGRLVRLAPRGASVEVQWSGDGEAVLAADACAHVERLVLEAVRNGFQHGDARRVGVRVAALPDAVEVAIEDDGCGFQPAAAAQSGLAHLALRAQALGGTLELNSGASGTALKLHIPRPVASSLD